MRRLLILLPALCLAACGPADPVTDWRVIIHLPQAELPVRLHLPPDGGPAWFENGVEKVPVPEVTRAGDAWTLHFPTFNNTFVLRQVGERLEGSLTLVKRGYAQEMPVSAAPDPGYRFREDPQPAVDVTGRWAVEFIDEDGKRSAAVAEFDQQGGQLAGTFLTPTGDYRFLAGDVDGRELWLSTFDGAHAFAFRATLTEAGQLEGDFWSGTRWHERWVAERDFDAALPDAFELTFLKPGYETLDFTFPDLDGKPVSLDDAKYQGKVVLVSLSGTWCPNCADEAEFLAGYYRDNRDRGLEVITLLYEHFEDFELAARQGRALRDKHGIDYDLLVAGLSDKTLAAETLPMLNHVLAFPTLIFIGRDGAVRHIHTGFAGPGTGEHYATFKRQFEERMEALLAEPVPGAGVARNR